jgi:hypothetical protein
MQVTITPQEQTTLIQLTSLKGRTKWFCDKAGINWASLQKLRTLARADEEVVKKMRSVLKSKDAKALIALESETAGVS